MDRSGKVVVKEQLIRSVASSSALSNGKSIEENEKMVIEDKYGNMFNVEGVIRCETDPTELKKLCNALFEKVKESEKLLDDVWGACEKYGVDIDELLQMYEGEDD